MSAKSEKKCGACAKKIHGNAVYIECIGCKMFLHGGCCIPAISRKNASTYANAPFVCHFCCEHAKTHQSLVLPSCEDDVATKKTKKVTENSGCCTHCIDSRSRLDRLEKEIRDLKQLFANVERNQQFWDSKLEEKSKALDSRIKRVNEVCAATTCQELDVVVPNIPEIADEDIGELSRCVLRSLVHDMKDTDILEAKRFTSKNESPGLIRVTMNNTRNKVKLIKAARSKKLKIGDLDLGKKLDQCSKNSKPSFKSSERASVLMSKGLFVNDSLSQQNRSLLNKALTLKRNGTIHAVWSSGGKVYLRKAEADFPILISSHSDLVPYLPSGSSSVLVPPKVIRSHSPQKELPSKSGFVKMIPDFSPILDKTVLLVDYSGHDTTILTEN